MLFPKTIELSLEEIRSLSELIDYVLALWRWYQRPAVLVNALSEKLETQRKY